MSDVWFDAVPAEVEAVRERVLNAAHRVHRKIGPGFREKIYETFLVHALRRDGIRVDQQVSLDLEFEGLVIHQAGRADLIVEQCLVVEVKAVDARVHGAQVISYLKSSGLPLGIVLNFNVPLLREGYGRYVHPTLLRKR